MGTLQWDGPFFVIPLVFQLQVSIISLVFLFPQGYMPSRKKDILSRLCPQGVDTRSTHSSRFKMHSTTMTATQPQTLSHNVSSRHARTRSRKIKGGNNMTSEGEKEPKSRSKFVSPATTARGILSMDARIKHEKNSWLNKDFHARGKSLQFTDPG